MIRMLPKNKNKIINIALLLLMLFLLFSVTGIHDNSRFLLTHLLIIFLSVLLALTMGHWNFFLYYILPCMLIGMTKTLNLFFFNLEIAEFIALYSLILFFIIIFIKSRNKTQIKTGLELPIMAFILFCFVSLINAYYKTSTLRGIGQFIIGFLCFYAVFYLVENRKQLGQLSWILIILGTFTASLSILQAFSFDIFSSFAKLIVGATGIAAIKNTFYYSNRIVGVWQQHNLATIFNFFIPLCYANILANKKFSTKILCGLCALIMILALFLTDTRTNIATFAIILIIFFILCSRKKLFFVIALVLIISSTASYIFILHSDFSRFTGEEQKYVSGVANKMQTTSEFELRKQDAIKSLTVVEIGKFMCSSACLNPITCSHPCIPFIDYIPYEENINTYTQGRVYLIRRGLELFKLHPLTGIGLGNSYYYPEDMRSYIREGEATHNIYIEILASVGLFGFLAFLFLLYKSFKNDLQLAFKGKFKNDLLILAFSTGSLTLLIDGLTQPGMFYWQLNAIFWVYRGVIHSVNLKRIAN